MTEITFENAALSEIIKRVERITPKKGDAFDKAGGIVIDIDPDVEWGVKIEATNLDVFYRELAGHLGISGEKVRWRVSSFMFSAMIAKLPIGTGKHVTLSEKDGMLHIQSGRFKAKLALLPIEYYPTWDSFDPGITAPVSNLGSRIQQVSWAVDNSAAGSAISGIYFDGKMLAATDRYRLAVVPCEAPHIPEEVVVPMSVVGPLVKNMGDTSVGIIDNQLAFMPNEYTQIRCVIFDAKFPQIERIMKRDQPAEISFSKEEVLAAIGRVTTANQKDRQPELSMFIGLEQIAFYMQDSAGTESAGDIVDIPGQATHERRRIYLTPSALIDPLQAAPDDRIVLRYDPTVSKQTLLIQSSGGYEAWIVTRSGFQKKDV